MCHVQSLETTFTLAPLILLTTFSSIVILLNYIYIYIYITPFHASLLQIIGWNLVGCNIMGPY
jgi:hypothetical protein